MELIRYEAACRAVAAAKSIDEASEIVSKAEAVKAYARQARNRDLEIDAREIRIRAERRMGEIILEIRKEKTFKAGRPRLIDDLGINGNLAAAAQRLALVPEKDFEFQIGEWRKAAVDAKHVRSPLAEVRDPSAFISQAKERATTRPLDASDPLDEFRTLDGRTFAELLIGELRRIEALTRRQLAALTAIRDGMPIANADQLQTVRKVFSEAQLLALLQCAWEEGAVPNTANALAGLPSRRGGKREGAGRRRCIGDGESSEKTTMGRQA